MPLYEYQCPDGHIIERVRAMDLRASPVRCTEPKRTPRGRDLGVCGKLARLIVSRPHVAPDGVYSYEPNVGDPDVFEQRREAIKAGNKVIPKLESRAAKRRREDEGGIP